MWLRCSLPAERILRAARAVAGLITVMVPVLYGCGGGGGGGGVPPGANANLAALIVDQVVLNPAFAPAVLAYTANVANGVAQTRVTPTAADPAATISVTGVVVASGATSAPIALVVGDNTLTVRVTAANGITQRSYTVLVTRRPPPSNDASLSDLALTVAVLDQPFDPLNLNYDATVGYFGASTRVLATPADAGATLTLNGAALPPGVASVLVQLNVGANTLTVQVTAEDGVTIRTYQVVATRATLATVGQQAYMKASNTRFDQVFAASLGLSADRLAAGAPGESSAATGLNGNQLDISKPDAGAVYLFERLGGVWAQTDYVKASNTDQGDFFGSRVALDGDTLAVAARAEQSQATGIDGDQTNNAGVTVGAVYVLRDAGAGAWNYAAYVKASNAGDGDQFGWALALRGDLMAVGAPFEQSDAMGVNGDQANNNFSNAGAAYVFARNAADQWAQTAYVKASNTQANDRFGSALALSGVTLAVGAPGEASNGSQANNDLPGAGAAYVFVRNAQGVWAQQAYVKAANAGQDDAFGTALALDGDLLAVGAPREASDAAGIGGDPDNNAKPNSGAVYVFIRSAQGIWTQEAYIKAANPDQNDGFGAALAFQGNLLVVGAPGEQSNATGINGAAGDNSLNSAGAVYVFERRAGGNWLQIAYVKASNPDSLDFFGSAVALDRDTVVGGAPEEQSKSTGVNGDETDDSESRAGAGYVLQ